MNNLCPPARSLDTTFALFCVLFKLRRPFVGRDGPICIGAEQPIRSLRSKSPSAGEGIDSGCGDSAFFLEGGGAASANSSRRRVRNDDASSTSSPMLAETFVENCAPFDIHQRPKLKSKVEKPSTYMLVHEDWQEKALALGSDRPSIYSD